MWAGLLTRPRGSDWCCVVGAHCAGHHKLYLVLAAFLSLHENNSWSSHSFANTLVIYIGYRTHLRFPISDWPGSFSLRQIRSFLCPCGASPTAYSLGGNQISIRLWAQRNPSGWFAVNRKMFLHARKQKEKVFHPWSFSSEYFFGITYHHTTLSYVRFRV